MKKQLKLLTLILTLLLPNQVLAAASAATSEFDPDGFHALRVVKGDSVLERGSGQTLTVKSINAHDIETWRAFQTKIGSKNTEFIEGARALLGSDTSVHVGEELTKEEVEVFKQMAFGDPAEHAVGHITLAGEITGPIELQGIEITAPGGSSVPSISTGATVDHVGTLPERIVDPEGLIMAPQSVPQSAIGGNIILTSTGSAISGHAGEESAEETTE